MARGSAVDNSAWSTALHSAWNWILTALDHLAGAPVNGTARPGPHAARLEQQARNGTRPALLSRDEAQADRLEEVQDLNRQVKDAMRGLRTVLTQALAAHGSDAFQHLRQHVQAEPFVAPEHLRYGPPPQRVSPPQPGLLAALIPGAAARYDLAVARAKTDYEQQLDAFSRNETAKACELARLRAQHDQRRTAREAEAARWNAQVDDFEAAYLRKDHEAITAYHELVLEQSAYPQWGFPKRFRVGYVPATGELIIEYGLPRSSVVPLACEYRYVPATHCIEAEPRRAVDIKRTYEDLIAAIALRTLHESLQADRAGVLQTVTFTGHVEAADAQGQAVEVPLISVRADKAALAQLQLDARCDKLECLRRLQARLSAQPDQMQPVEPPATLQPGTPARRLDAPAAADRAVQSRPGELGVVA